MIVSIEHEHTPARIANQCPRIVELARLTSHVSPIAYQFAIESELLNSMVSKFADQHMSLAIEDKIVGVAEFAKLVSLFAPAADQFGFVASRVENLDAMVAGIRDPDVVIRIHREILRANKFSRFRPVSAPLKEKLTLARELLYAIVFAILSNVIITF